MNISILMKMSDDKVKELALKARDLARFSLKKTINDNMLSTECDLSYSGIGKSSHYSLTVTINKSAYSYPRFAMHYKKYCIKNNIDFDMIDKEFLTHDNATVKFVGSCIRNRKINAVYIQNNNLYCLTLSEFMSRINHVI